jgi:hypothetical protein
MSFLVFFTVLFSQFLFGCWENSGNEVVREKNQKNTELYISSMLSSLCILLQIV